MVKGNIDVRGLMESEGEYWTNIIQEAHEAKILKQFLFKKLKGFGGISHNELEVICAMFGIREEGDSA